MYERYIDVCIQIISDGEYAVTLVDQESGDEVRHEFEFVPQRDNDYMKEIIGNEIIGWVEMLLEQKFDDERN